MSISHAQPLADPLADTDFVVVGCSLSISPYSSGPFANRHGRFADVGGKKKKLRRVRGVFEGL